MVGAHYSAFTSMRRIFRPQKVIHEDHGSFHSWMTPHNVSKICNCRIDRGRETDSRIARIVRFVGSGRTMSLNMQFSNRLGSS